MVPDRRENRIFPAALQRYMANAPVRAAWSKSRAPHVAGISRPETTAELILEAAALPVAA